MTQTQLQKKSTTAICQNWLESERGWGQRPDGHTLHLTLEDCRKFREEFWARQPKSYVPDEYTREAGQPFKVRIGAESFKKLLSARKKGEHGIWGHVTSWR